MKLDPWFICKQCATFKAILGHKLLTKVILCHCLTYQPELTSFYAWCYVQLPLWIPLSTLSRHALLTMHQSYCLQHWQQYFRKLENDRSSYSACYYTKLSWKPLHDSVATPENHDQLSRNYKSASSITFLVEY